MLRDTLQPLRGLPARSCALPQPPHASRPCQRCAHRPRPYALYPAATHHEPTPSASRALPHRLDHRSIVAGAAPPPPKGLLSRSASEISTSYQDVAPTDRAFAPYRVTSINRSINNQASKLRSAFNTAFALGPTICSIQVRIECDLQSHSVAWIVELSTHVAWKQIGRNS